MKMALVYLSVHFGNVDGLMTINNGIICLNECGSFQGNNSSINCEWGIMGHCLCRL